MLHGFCWVFQRVFPYSCSLFLFVPIVPFFHLNLGPSPNELQHLKKKPSVSISYGIYDFACDLKFNMLRQTGWCFEMQYIYTCICAPTHDIYRFGMIPHDWYLLDGLKLPAGSNVAGSSTRSTSSAGCAAFLFGNPGGGVWCSNDVWYYAGSVPCIIAYYHIIILLHFSEWIPQKQWVYLCNHWINMMNLRFQIVVVIVLVMCGHDMTWHDMRDRGPKKK